MIIPFRNKVVVVAPILEGRLIRLGVNTELDERERIELLSLFRNEVPQLYRLRSFVLSTPPAGSAEPCLTEEVRWLGFSDWLIKGQSGNWYRVQVGQDGTPTCSCPDFTHRRRGKGNWCKHIVGLHQFLQRALQPKEGFQLLPAWRVREKTPMSELIEAVGGLFAVEQAEPIYQASYSHQRERYDAPMLGVEFEVPRYSEELDHLRKLLSILREKSIILSYEYDGSVIGEIKFSPFPATLEKVNEVAVIMEGIKALYCRLFERGGYAGIHVHINVYPLNLADRSYVHVGTWFRKNFDLPKIFGRYFNRYAKDRVSTRDRYSWLNLTNLPETVEVRLGSAYGEPRKILYGALLLQRVIWAKKDGFRLPNRASQRFEKLLNLFSDEEKKVMAPFLREHLVPARGD